MGMDFLVLSFVVVVVGGMGSLPGAEFRCALREARSLSKHALGNGDADIFINNTRSGDESCQVIL